MGTFLRIAGAFFALLVLAAGAVLWYSLMVPGKRHSGPVPPATAEEQDLAGRLRRHVTAIASVPHNVRHYEALETAARYIEATLEGLGYKVGRQVYEVEGKPVRNIDVVVEPASGSAAAATIVIGAHYDSAGIAPGANDNGTGAAAVLELARMLKGRGPFRQRLRLVLFVNEECPYCWTESMGSFRYARALKERGEAVAGMVSLETLGAFYEQPGTQRYPAPFGLIFPDTANFVAFVGMPGSRTWLHEVMGSFRRHAAIPTIGGIAPEQIAGIGWSDHWSFMKHGFPAIMVTDTALFRYPHYHRATDTPDKVDYAKLALITRGMREVVLEVTGQP